METAHKEQKIAFLDDILKIAENYPKVIDKGVEIFDADSHHVQEECSITIKLDEKGKPYFTIKGNYTKNNQITEPEILLMAGERYFSSNLNKFKQEFHLYKDYSKQTHETDLINVIR